MNIRDALKLLNEKGYPHYIERKDWGNPDSDYPHTAIIPLSGFSSLNREFPMNSFDDFLSGIFGRNSGIQLEQEFAMVENSKIKFLDSFWVSDFYGYRDFIVKLPYNFDKTVQEKIIQIQENLEWLHLNDKRSHEIMTSYGAIIKNR